MKVIDIILKNISQVLLINNKWTGLFVLIGLFIANWKIGLSALIASLVSYVLASYMNYSIEEINNGLAGFNPVLTAIALILFLDNNWSGIIVTIIATVLTLPVGAAIRELLKPYGIAMLTSPFVIVTWIAILIPGQVKSLNTQLDIIPSQVNKTSFSHNYEHIQILQSILEGFSQVFLVPSLLGGLLIIIGIFIGSKKAVMLALLANVVGFIAIAVLGGNTNEINEGLFGYNLVLTVIALGVTFKTSMNAYITTILGVILTVFIQLGLNTLLMPFCLPALTVPFILAAWLMLFAGINHTSKD
ncbi:urea transporter [Staphylococcus saccharolyticus]|uniref:Urea transporter n=1 Tax=Staphylococcus saccharolyticus TaxID=33028 RepID=A0A380H3E4_9STAP|nr:urea transporter [Staphylococcus saccharolyticus]MBL7564868.1 urea transporter [Staphylococcus saccharolyticus]MBL7570868.1 urea transporter [Staphylococcus saccharolyticus]QQB98730.1 urea transporter [Staphylococcus saccharolyticus]QRJ67055.1 urea transporter [Staphylococcus saccharolyticus]RTX96998.1 urea transporter [Staphylococcus saccharolyticus]